MEQETIVYFYPISEQQGAAGRVCSAKWYWFQDVSLRTYLLGEVHATFNVIGCAVPPYYFRNRPWKPQVLSEEMAKVMRRVDGMTDTYLHPQIEAMLTAEYVRRWMPRRNTVQMIVGQLIEQYVPGVVKQCEEAVVLLGEAADTGWQMEMTRELLQPYQARINRMLIFYEEVAETDIWMELGSHLDDYYYEYGLVPQIEPYAETADGLRCGKHKCEGIVLDYCTQFRYPKIMPDSKAVYIDTMSVGCKERMLARKTPKIPYVSPLKYLDTMVKNS